MHITSAIVKGSGFENGENRSNILRVKNGKKKKKKNLTTLHEGSTFTRFC